MERRILSAKSKIKHRNKTTLSTALPDTTMASTTRGLSRMALLISRRPRTARPQAINYQIAPIGRQTRFFSSSPFTYLPEDPPVPPEPRDFSAEDIEDLPEYSPDQFTSEEKTMYEMMSSEERAVFDEENRRFVEMWNDTNQRARDFSEIEQGAARIEREQPMRFEDLKMRHRGFWADEEEDEFAAAEDGDEDFNDDEITSMAHAELEQHREVREYARIAAWDMPLLSSMCFPRICDVPVSH
jgi:small subunit ribosomal protein S35